jgi:hypothetical protein
MSKLNHIAVTLAALAGLTALPAAAQQKAEQRTPARLEITMTLLPEKAKDATEITRKIELPVAGRDKGDKGDKGDGKRPAELPGAEHGKGQGLDTAAEARERGREFGQAVSEQARDNRENAGRRDDHPSGPPADLPVPPRNGPPPKP